MLSPILTFLMLMHLTHWEISYDASKAYYVSFNKPKLCFQFYIYVTVLNISPKLMRSLSGIERNWTLHSSWSILSASTYSIFFSFLFVQFNFLLFEYIWSWTSVSPLQQWTPRMLINRNLTSIIHESHLWKSRYK